MPDEKLYTLRQISQELNLAESTVRYYRDLFAVYLPTVGTGRRRRYPARAVSILRLVAEGYAKNRSRDEIETHLNSLQAESVEAEPVVGFDRGGPGVEGSDEPIARYLNGERDHRDAMWHMAREIVRLGESIDRQGAVLGELAKQLAEQSNRTLPPPPVPQTPAEAATTAPAYTAPEPVSPSPPAAAPAPTSDIDAPGVPHRAQPAPSRSRPENGPRDPSSMTEIVRLSETIDRQGVLLGELAKQLAQQSDRTLPGPPIPQAPAQVVPTPPDYAAPEPVAPSPPYAAQPQTWNTAAPEVPEPTQPAPSEPGPEARPRDASSMAEPMMTRPPEPVLAKAVEETGPEHEPESETSGEELKTLQEELARERDLVERLRRSKMEIERRAAEAESRLGYGSEPPVPRPSRKSMFTRFFNSG